MANRIISEFYWGRFKIHIDFESKISFLEDLKILCNSAKDCLKDFGVMDNHLGIIFHQISDILSTSCEKRPARIQTFEFIRAVCTKVVKHLEYSTPAYDPTFFEKIKLITNESPELGRATIDQRMKDAKAPPPSGKRLPRSKSKRGDTRSSLRGGEPSR